MKREIWRNYPVGEKVELVERLLERGVLDEGAPRRRKQPGRCCATGCEAPSLPEAAEWARVSALEKPKQRRRPMDADAQSRYAASLRRLEGRSVRLLGRAGPRDRLGQARRNSVRRRMPAFTAAGSSAAECNLCHNAVDRHVRLGAGEQAALIYDLDRDRTEARLHLRRAAWPRSSGWRPCCSGSASETATGS